MMTEPDNASRSASVPSPVVYSAYLTRLAPTPSGHLHVGHAQTFWIATQRAHHFGGRILLRVEDIDVVRCKPHFLPQMLEDLTWFGFSWHLGFTPTRPETQTYIQSRRFALYATAWRRLLRAGCVYPCQLSRRDVEQALTAPHEEATPGAEAVFPPRLRPPYVQADDREDRHFPADVRALAAPTDLRANWRFRVPDGQAVRFIDGACGPQSFVAGVDFGDFVVWRSDGFPAYELAAAVDDVVMGISEVVRGCDLLLSTARQLLLMKHIFDLDFDNDAHWHAKPCAAAAVVAEDTDCPDGAGGEVEMELMRRGQVRRIPRYFHTPLVCGEDGVRLAKRSGATSLRRLREEGQTPSAIRERFFDKRFRGATWIDCEGREKEEREDVATSQER